MIRVDLRRTLIRLGALFFMALMLGACHSRPSKYKKKKKGCDCPKWSQVEGAGQHTALSDGQDAAAPMPHLEATNGHFR
jgi:hypothetical protein